MAPRPGCRREALLTELCSRYGYCCDLDADALAGAMSAQEVVQRVLVAMELDPTLSGRAVHAPLIRAAEDWLFDPEGRGAKSGLPL